MPSFFLPGASTYLVACLLVFLLAFGLLVFGHGLEAPSLGLRNEAWWWYSDSLSLLEVIFIFSLDNQASFLFASRDILFSLLFFGGGRGGVQVIIVHLIFGRDNVRVEAFVRL